MIKAAFWTRAQSLVFFILYRDQSLWAGPIRICGHAHNAVSGDWYTAYSFFFNIRFVSNHKKQIYGWKYLFFPGSAIIMVRCRLIDCIYVLTLNTKYSTLSSQPQNNCSIYELITYMIQGSSKNFQSTGAIEYYRVHIS